MRESPLKEIADILRERLVSIVKALGYSFAENWVVVSPTKLRAHGDLTTTIAFRIAKFISKKEGTKISPQEIAEKIASKLNIDQLEFISRVEIINGYINFFFDRGKFVSFALERLNKFLAQEHHPAEGIRILIEHTSANPAHPLHIGHARNAFIGDSLKRIYQYLGFPVQTRFFINDCGRQIAFLAYAYDRLNRPKDTHSKPDHFIGVLYSLISNFVELINAVRALSTIKSELFNRVLSDTSKKTSIDPLRLTTIDLIDFIMRTAGLNSNLNKETQRLRHAISEYLTTLANLAKKWPDIFLLLLEKIDSAAPEHISNILIKYEKGDPRIRELFRDLVNYVMSGFKETLNIFSIEFDYYDYESELLWMGLIKAVLEKLESRSYVINEPGTSAKFLNIKKLINDFPKLRELFMSEKSELKTLKNPPLTRSDGTSLYLLRDIAYATYKLKLADKIINVIGIDQTLEQKYVIAALVGMFGDSVLGRYQHLGYELVRLPNRKMSSRKGQYITLDELLYETIQKARDEILKRYPHYNDYQIDALAKAIAISALKYALLGQAPNKVINFDWSRVLNFEQNSGPFIQYSHARASSILRKINWKIPEKPRLNTLTSDYEYELVLMLIRFPEIIRAAAEESRPDILANFANELSVVFNRFYQEVRVLQTNDPSLRDARVFLVSIFRRTLATVLKLLGISPLYKM